MEAQAKERECVLFDMRFSKTERMTMIANFVDTDLCSCSREKFYDNDLSTLEFMEKAFIESVINEVVLRVMAEKVKP